MLGNMKVENNFFLIIFTTVWISFSMVPVLLFIFLILFLTVYWESGQFPTKEVKVNGNCSRTWGLI